MHRKQQVSGFFATFILAAVAGSVLAKPALGDIDCTNGIPLYGSTYTATDNYFTTSPSGSGVPCLIVNGQGLNMAGHTITCLNTTQECDTAIAASDSTYATVTIKNAEIVGPFTIGINALDVQTNLPVVTANKLRGYLGVGILSGGRITGNVIFGDIGPACTNFAAIDFRPNNHTATSQYVQDNYIDCNAPSAVGIVSTSGYTGTGNGPKVQNNFVRAPGMDLAVNWYMPNSGKVYFYKNILESPACGTGLGGYYSGSTLVTVSDNVCNRDLQAIDPATCPETATPFTLP